MSDLAAAWADAVAVLGGSRVQALVSGAELAERYAGPDRRYHGTAHVAQVLRDSAELGVALGLSADELAVVALAACAHDVVYDGRPGEDERASAAWARTALAAAGVATAHAARVAGLVLATIEHAPDPRDLPAVALMDADLAVLAAPSAAYEAYRAAVREEYAAFDDALWSVGRTAVLQSLLGRVRLYASDAAHERWDAAARANLLAELATL